MKIDATCCDAEVRYPTDVDLLEDGSWDAYNEESDLELQIELYRKMPGVFTGESLCRQDLHEQGQSPDHEET